MKTTKNRTSLSWLKPDSSGLLSLSRVFGSMNTRGKTETRLDDVTTGAIMEQLFFKQQVEKGLQDVAESRVLTREVLKERIAR